MMIIPTGGIPGALVRHALSRFTRRGVARRELDQIRIEVEQCALMYVALTQGGTIPPNRLPTQSLKYLAPLHAEGLLNESEFEALKMYFEPAEQANMWLTSPEQQGPEAENASRRLTFLLQGRKYAEWRDADGNTLLDLARRAIDGALSEIERRRWRPW